VVKLLRDLELEETNKAVTAPISALKTQSEPEINYNLMLLAGLALGLALFIIDSLGAVSEAASEL
jgi:hypothetical protein